MIQVLYDKELPESPSSTKPKKGASLGAGGLRRRLWRFLGLSATSHCLYHYIELHSYKGLGLEVQLCCKALGLFKLLFFEGFFQCLGFKATVMTTAWLPAAAHHAHAAGPGILM